MSVTWSKKGKPPSAGDDPMLTDEDRQRRLKAFDLRLRSLVRQRRKYRHESEQAATVAVSQSRTGQRIASRRKLLVAAPGKETE
jgi:hypothetical protein